jgi:hypothetical protein
MPGIKGMSLGPWSNNSLDPALSLCLKRQGIPPVGIGEGSEVVGSSSSSSRSSSSSSSKCTAATQTCAEEAGSAVHAMPREALGGWEQGRLGERRRGKRSGGEGGGK